MYKYNTAFKIKNHNQIYTQDKIKDTYFHIPLDFVIKNGSNHLRI